MGITAGPKVFYVGEIKPVHPESGQKKSTKKRQTRLKKWEGAENNYKGDQP